MAFGGRGAPRGGGGMRGGRGGGRGGFGDRGGRGGGRGGFGGRGTMLFFLIAALIVGC